MSASCAAWLAATMRSKVDVVSRLVSWLETIRPNSMTAPSGAFVAPTIFHFPYRPSPDTAPVNVSRLRVSLSHAGSGALPPAMNFIDSPGAGRAMNSTPPSALTSRTTAWDPSRIMTPACARALVFSSDATRTTISPAATIHCETK